MVPSDPSRASAPGSSLYFLTTSAKAVPARNSSRACIARRQASSRKRTMCAFAVFAPWYCTSKCCAVIFAGWFALCGRLALAIARHASASDFPAFPGDAAAGAEPPQRKLATVTARRNENGAQTESLDMGVDRAVDTSCVFRLEEARKDASGEKGGFFSPSLASPFFAS